jgi:hypothetical protein
MFERQNARNQRRTDSVNAALSRIGSDRPLQKPKEKKELQTRFSGHHRCHRARAWDDVR